MGGRGKGFIAAFATAVGLILAIVSIAIALWPKESISAKNYVKNHGTPTCSDPKWLVAVPNDQISATSYYVAKPHSANLTVDGNQDTAWLQRWPTTDLPGNKPRYNRIHWDFSPNAYDLRLICIIDGWTQDYQTYESTEPIRNATIDLRTKSCPLYPATFINKGFTHKWQEVRVLCKTSNVRLVVQSTYQTKGPWHLTGISEVKFYYTPSAVMGPQWSPPVNQK